MKTNLQEINALHDSELYLYFYEDFIDADKTIKECEFINKACELKPGSKVLDLACGHGRHALILSKYQYNVTGIDINRDFIELAKYKASEQNLNIHFIVDNILNINYKEEFDGILLLYNSFGFLDGQDARKLMQKLKSALMRTGKILIDLRNRETAIRNWNSCQVTEKGQDLMIDRLSFHLNNGTVTNRRIYIKDNVRYDTPFTMQLYNLSEFSALIETLELRIVKVFGNWDKSAFTEDSPRIIAIIEHQ